MAKSDKKIDNFEFYQEQVGDRIITICAGEKIWSTGSELYVGIAIRHPVKEDREGLGSKIAKNRCLSATDSKKRKRNNKMKRVASIKTTNLTNDRFLLQQTAKSYFFHVKHNLDKYVAAYGTG